MHKYFFISLLLTLASCNQDGSRVQEEEALQDKLPATLVHNPRSLNGTDSVKLQELGKLVFEDTIHNFGTLSEGEQVTYEFSFTNKGQKDLLINEAKASCGCTVADYPTHPFKENQTGKIKVTFNSEGKLGMNERAVVITTNGNPSLYNLIIQAQVLDKE
jgi:hypothetical protein